MNKFSTDEVEQGMAFYRKGEFDNGKADYDVI